MDRTDYRPPCMPEAPRVPYYRPPSEPPWPPRFSAPPPGGPPPQYGCPGGHPSHYNNGVRNEMITNNAWPSAPEHHGAPVSVTAAKPGWHDHSHTHDDHDGVGRSHGYSNANGRARLQYADVNSAVDRNSSPMEADNSNTWPHEDNYRTNNNGNAVTFPAGMHSMPPPSHNSAVAPPPPPPSRGYPSSAELIQPPPEIMHSPSATPVYLQHPPPIQYNVPPPGGHLSQPPATQYPYPPVRPKETVVRPHPAVTRPYTENRSDSFVRSTLQLVQAPDKIVAKENEDQVWVNRWLERHGTFRRRKTKAKKQISIPEARMKLRESVLLSDRLKCCCAELTNEALESEAERERLCVEVEHIKEKLSQLKCEFEEGQIIAELQRKIKRVTQKRERLKRQRQEKYLEKLEAEERRTMAHERLDRWQDSLVEKTLQLKRDKELKAAADETLREVRSKVTDVKKALQLMTDLQKLRQVRKEMAEKKGLFVRQDIAKNFETRISSLVDLLTRQNETYETEKGLLEVMLETEQQETEERMEEDQQRKLAAREQRCERRIRRVLFSHDESLPPSHPLFHYRQYYDAAEYNADSFLRTRQDWDLFLVPPGTNDGSRIPHNWVVPTEPSSTTWATALLE